MSSESSRDTGFAASNNSPLSVYSDGSGAAGGQTNVIFELQNINIRKMSRPKLFTNIFLIGHFLSQKKINHILLSPSNRWINSVFVTNRKCTELMVHWQEWLRQKQTNHFHRSYWTMLAVKRWFGAPCIRHMRRTNVCIRTVWLFVVNRTIAVIRTM